MGGSRDSLVLRGGAGLLLGVLGVLWVGLLIVTTLLGEDEEEPMLALLFIASVLTLFGSAALTGASRPTTPAALGLALLTGLALVATIGLLLALCVQRVQGGRKGD